MTKNEIYRTVKTSTEGLYKDRGSKFLAYVIPCATPEEAKSHIDSLRKNHPAAVHVCYAWRFGKSTYGDRFSDDGEPTNSAGKPIFGQIVSFGITNVLIAVVRYYGGTNLGVGGLMVAYKSAAVDALEKAIIQDHFLCDYFSLTHLYDQTGDVINLLQKSQTDIISRNFDELNPVIIFKIRKTFSQRLLNELSGRYTIKQTGTDE